MQATLSGKPVPVQVSMLDWQRQGLTYTATGYGNRIPTRYMVRVNNRWRRVYCAIWSNIGTLYIGSRKTAQIVEVAE